MPSAGPSEPEACGPDEVRILRWPLGPGQPHGHPVPSSAGFLLSVPNCPSTLVASMPWPSLLPAPPAEPPTSFLALLGCHPQPPRSPQTPRWLVILWPRHRRFDVATASPHPAGCELPRWGSGASLLDGSPQHREPGLARQPTGNTDQKSRWSHGLLCHCSRWRPPGLTGPSGVMQSRADGEGGHHPLRLPLRARGRGSRGRSVPWGRAKGGGLRGKDPCAQCLGERLV